jgi:hypothetical protein
MEVEELVEPLAVGHAPAAVDDGLRRWAEAHPPIVSRGAC